MQSQPFNEKNYRESKEKNLRKILGELYRDVEWIWVGGNSRRKVTFQIDGKNRLGTFAERSKNLIEINDDPLAEKEISDLIPELKNFLKTQDQNLYSQIVTTLFDNGLDLVFVGSRDLNFSQTQKLMEFAKAKNLNISYRTKNNLTPIFLIRKNQIFYPDFKINLDSEIFIQATKSGLESIIKKIRSEIKQGQNVIDIYAGFGAYTFAISDLAKSVFAVEGDQKMVDLLNKNATQNNLGTKIKAETRDLFLDPVPAKELRKLDMAIINPPRNGAAPQILQISKSGLKKVVYVSCNPESFKPDAKTLIDSGFKITSLTALDQFYNTKHLELIATFEKS